MNIYIGKKDYIWSYLSYILRFGANLFVFPLILNILPQAEYGLWVTFASIGSMIYLFDFGFSSTIMRNITYVWSGAQSIQAEGYTKSKSENRNVQLFATTLKVCKYIYIVMGIVSLVIAWTVGVVYVNAIISSIFKPSLIIAWLIYGVNISIHMYMNYWSGALRAIGGIQQEQKVQIVGSCVQIIVSYIGVILGGGLIALSLAGGLLGIVSGILCKHYLFRYMKENNVHIEQKGDIKKQEILKTFRTFWFNAKKAGISSIATVTISQSTILFSSYYFGVEASAQYGICLQILNLLSNISRIYFQATIPQMTQVRQQGNNKICKSLFATSITIAWVIYLVGMLFIIIFGQTIFSLIKSQTQLNMLMFIIVGLIVLGEMNYSIHASLISFSNRLPFVPSVVVTSIVLIITSFMIGKFSWGGMWELLMLKLLIETAYIFWKWPQVARKELEASALDMLRIGITNIKNHIKSNLN